MSVGEVAAAVDRQGKGAGEQVVLRAGITGWLSRLAGGAEKPNLVAGGSRRQINNTDAARAQGALPLSWKEGGHPVVRRG